MKSPLNTKAAFSLIEVLVSVALILVLTGLAVVAFNNISRSFSIGAAGQQARSAILVAAQEATARSRPVEMRLCRATGSENPTVIQFILHESDGSTRPLQRPLVTSEQVVIDGRTNQSTLLSGLAYRAAGPADPRAAGLGTSYEYAGFFLLPGGITSLSSNSTQAPVLVFRSANDSGTPPANFAAIQLDPHTSRTQLHRP